MALQTSLVDQGTRLGLRLLSRTGGSRWVKENDQLRAAVERVLYRGSQQGFRSMATVATVRKRAFRRAGGSGAVVRQPVTDRPGLFDLTPSEDQAMIQGVARELADEVIRGAGSRADTDRAVPQEVRDAAAQIGLTTIGVPAELGGIAEERSAVTSALLLEELARGDLGIAVALMAPAAVANALALYGDAAQQATYLSAFTGDEPPYAAALAFQEPQPLFDPLAPATTAKRDGDDLVLTGVKAIVPGACDAELFVVSATVDGQARMVIVEPGTDGVEVADDPAMGIRAASTGRLVLTDARVPAANLLGSADDHRDAVRRARVAWCAAACGTAQAALDQVSGYVTERKAFGEPIAHRQAVAFTVADMAIELDGLRLATWRAAARLDAGADAAEQVAVARSLCAAYAPVIGSAAVQLLGGHGFVKEFDNERWYRDLRGASLLEGTLLV